MDYLKDLFLGAASLFGLISIFKIIGICRQAKTNEKNEKIAEVKRNVETVKNDNASKSDDELFNRARDRFSTDRKDQ